jgi:acid phosphatase type 7
LLSFYCRRGLRAVALALVLAASIGVSSCSDSHSPTVPSAGGGSTTPPTSTPTADPRTAEPTTETLIGAGDIAICGSRGAAETAKLLDSIPGTVFTAGDNVYPSGTDQAYRDCYDPTWGRHRQRTRPTPGNHEYEVPGASGYFGYYGPNAGLPGMGYYSYRLGAWQIYSLNSNVPTDESSAQYQWLAAELAANPSSCSLAYWHHPIVSEGPNGSSRHMRSLWRLLSDQGVDVVITGHDHGYQRYVPLDGDLRPNPQRGIRQFVIGTGGAPLYEFPTLTGFSESRGRAWGLLKLSLSASRYDWEFVPVPGESFRDAGQGTCH